MLILLFLPMLSNPGITNIDNSGAFRFPDSKIPGIVEKNGFVLVPSHNNSFYDIYKDMMKNGEPVVLTSDLFLHTLNHLFDKALINIEMTRLSPELTALTKKMYGYSDGINKQYFETALSLIDPDFSSSHSRVKKELNLIANADGIHTSPLLGIKVDYSQFKVRGHYTKNDTLKRYFTCMMWYGVVRFPLKNKKFLKMAVQQMETLKKNQLMDTYKEIISPIDFLVGAPDDVSPLMLNKCTSPITIEKLRKLAGRIIPPGAEQKILYTFIPQRFIPDSYMFQMLTYNSVITYTGKDMPFTADRTYAGIQRVFPRSLDLMGVLGSKTAVKVLKTSGDADYENYAAKFQEMQKWWDAYEKGTIYDRYLEMYALMLREDIPTISPTHYAFKRLNTNCGGWTELRHHTILYAKQSYTMGITMVREKKKPVVYIEPYKKSYNKMEEIIQGLITFSTDDVKNDLINFDEIMKRIVSIVKNKKFPYTDADQEFLIGLPPRLKSLIDKREKVVAPLIADVHTDPNSKTVLEEGIGRPFLIYEAFNTPRGTKLFKGAVYSYYEFKQPMKKRLNDEEWKNTMDSKKPVDWMTKYILW